MKSMDSYMHWPRPRSWGGLKLLANRKFEFRVLDFIASEARSDESIQSKAILKILDMFFVRNRQCCLQTIHYYVISKIVDSESLISKTQLALRYPAFTKRRILGYTLREILLYSLKSISTIFEIRIASIVRFYAYVWFSRKPSNKRAYSKIMDSSGYFAKTIKSVKSIHVFKIYLVFDSPPSGPTAWTVTGMLNSVDRGICHHW